jgi:hypothetical protein
MSLQKKRENSVGAFLPATSPESVGDIWSRDSRINAACERRIDRCLAGMQNAKTWAWAARWSAAYLVLSRESEAKSPALVRDASTGDADRGSRSVSDLSPDTTTGVVEIATGARP